tara:strand:- start:1160 stop:1990 length:831 start_codon:yes stop_codon:yes gene_type:complete
MTSTDTPSISVICTVRNGALTLEETFRSILEQTLEDLELIVVDDGSTDNSLDLINEIAVRDSRVRLIEAGAVGRGSALNLGINASKGELIAIIDVDDPSHPKRLELQRQIMNEHEDVVLLCTGIVFVHGDGAPEWPSMEFSTPSNQLLIDVTQTIMRRNPICHSSVLMRKQPLLDLGAYDESRQSKFDYDLWVRFVEAGHKLHRLDYLLASKRFHESQSFDNNPSFVLETAPVQIRAIRILGGNWKDWLSVGARAAWYLLPAKLRWARHRGGNATR